MNVNPNSMYPVAWSFNTITDMKAQFDRLQTQLATGQKATTLAEMGNSRLISLSLRSRISAIDAYKASQDTLNLRFSMMSGALDQLGQMQSDIRTGTMVGDYGTNDINFTVQPQQARANLDLALNVLNTEENGHYLFAGNATDSPPVADNASILIDGDPANGLAGFHQIAAWQLEADQGAPDADGNHMGRLQAPVAAADTVTLAEEDTVFGLKLNAVTSTSAGVTITPPAGAQPQTASVQFASQPAAGDSVTVKLTLPDSTFATVTLTATSSAPPGEGEFTIGADTTGTAASFATALTSGIQKVAATELPVASKFQAANTFIAGQGQQPMVVDGPPYDTATALKPASPTDTVIWYKGGDSGSPDAAKRSVSARVADNTRVSYGVEGNESGFANFVRSLVVMADSSFSGDTAGGAYDATVSRQLNMLSSSHDNEAGSIKAISVGLGLAQATAKDVATRQTTYKGQLQDILGNVENIDDNTIASEILALQTRLQASYQTTAMISKLSLVNYMG
jgi:flagellin-like hook-associated protein FlgL